MAVNFLAKSLERDMLSHAYLLVGPSRVGKMTVAINLAQAVNCLAPPAQRPCGECRQCVRIAQGIHPDVQVIDLEPAASGGGLKRDVGIDQVRDVQRSSSLKPYEGASRVYIFREASALSDEAANALLKLLEEPPESVLMLLLTSRVDRLLPTIPSRCQRLDMSHVSQDLIARELELQHGVPADEAREIARLSGGSVGWALEAVRLPRLLEDHRADQERVAALMDAGLEERFAYAEETATVYAKDPEKGMERLTMALGWWRDVLLVKSGTPELVSSPESAEALRRHADGLTGPQVVEVVRGIQYAMACLGMNANARLALDVLMLSLPHREETPAASSRR